MRLLSLMLLFCIITTILIGCTQDSKKDIQELDAIINLNDNTISLLVSEIAKKDIALLGEATHGTQEFYEIRSQITKKLIQEHDFDFIVVEGDWNALYQLNLFVKGLSQKQTAAYVLNSFDRWPQWMWSNTVIEDLAQWLHTYNKDRPLDKKIGIYGLDVYGAEQSIAAVEEIIGQKYDCLSPFKEDFSLYARYLSLGNQPCKDQVQEIYQKINDRSYDQLTDLNQKEFFYLKQNAFVIKNAEIHYRAMVFPQLSSWNERVLHMNLTLSKLLETKGNKAIVWAHNTHVGDARATDMINSNSINIGQLLRQANKSSFILGFGTYTGQVVAGNSWGQDKEIMQIPPAHQGSYEYLLAQKDIDILLLMLNHQNLPKIYHQPHTNRAIGVTYNPNTEFPGNYVKTNLTNRYDAFIFIKETTALTPLS